MRVAHFVNLTNGIGLLPALQGQHVSYIRIQSTACEQKRWSHIILDLDYNLLMHLAAGYTCYVWDMGANKEVPRAVYQGLEFVRYCLSREWFNRDVKAHVRGNDCTAYFAEQYSKLDGSAKKKLRYFLPYLQAEGVSLIGLTAATSQDNNKAYFASVLQAVAE